MKRKTKRRTKRRKQRRKGKTKKINKKYKTCAKFFTKKHNLTKKKALKMCKVMFG